MKEKKKKDEVIIGGIELSRTDMIVGLLDGVKGQSCKNGSFAAGSRMRDKGTRLCSKNTSTVLQCQGCRQSS